MLTFLSKLLSYKVIDIFQNVDKINLLTQFNNIFQAHGVKGVLSMKANSKQDQLISAGKGILNYVFVYHDITYACNTYSSTHSSSI